MNRKISEIDSDYESYVRTGIGLVTGMGPDEFRELHSVMAKEDEDSLAYQTAVHKITKYRERGRAILRAVDQPDPDFYFSNQPIELSDEAIHIRLSAETQKILATLGTSSTLVVELIENLPTQLASGAALRDEIPLSSE